MVNANQFFAPIDWFRCAANKARFRSGPLGRFGNGRQQSLGYIVAIDESLNRSQVKSGRPIDKRARRARAHVTEVSGALFQRWNRCIESCWHPVLAPFLGPEKIGVVLPNRPPDGVAEIVLLIGGHNLLK